MEPEVPPIPQLFVIARDGRIVEHFVGEDPESGLSVWKNCHPIVSYSLLNN
jgi:hypothetical protein